MESEQADNAGNHNTEVGNSGGEPANDNPNNGVKEDEQKSDKSEECCNKQEIPQPLKFKFEKEKRTWKDWKRTEIISAISAGLSFIAIWIAAWALTNTIKSVNATQNIVKLTEKRDSISVEQTKAFNRPYLQVKCDSFRVFQPGQKMSIAFSFQNVGQYAAKITNVNFWSVVEKATIVNPFDPINKVQMENRPPSPINTYVIKDFKETREFNSDSIVTDQQALDIFSGNKFLFLFGEVKYINAFTGDSMNYRFNIRFEGESRFRNYTLLYSENAVN